MTNINFDEQSVGQVNAPEHTAALKVLAQGKAAIGIIGETTSNDSGAGVVGVSKKWIGVYGETTDAQGHAGVRGEAKHPEGGAGVIGKSINWVGVFGESETKIGIMGRAPTAGRFEGDVEVTGDIRLLNADCAEDFNISDSELKSVEAGTVMVLTENGSLQSSYQEYDKKVAGIVSGASGYKPGIILDRQELDQNNKNKDRRPIALMGKVYCKVDARHSSIEIGDLLTTSSTKGYAMKAEDPLKAFGAVIGKALGSIKEGFGTIPVLVALQ